MFCLFSGFGFRSGFFFVCFSAFCVFTYAVLSFLSDWPPPVFCAFLFSLCSDLSRRFVFVHLGIFICLAYMHVFLGQVDGLPLEEFLELSSLAMTDPMSGVALVPGGDEIDVTMDNVGDFVEAITTRWGFRTGRRPSALSLSSPLS